MKKVLLVDDEVDLLELITEDFEEAGYNVSTAFDGPSALKMILTNEYDLIVSDNHMPGFTGLELLEHMREHNNKTPVFIFSGNVDIEEQVIELGAKGLIKKPCFGRDIIERVQKC